MKFCYAEYYNSTMLSLHEVHSIASIKGRKLFLQEYLNNMPLGEELSDADNERMKDMFEAYYTPDLGERKYTRVEIDRFYINKHSIYGTKCFHIRLKDGVCDVATLKRLSGENRTHVQNLTRALRHAISPQIEEFRIRNLLQPLDICPVENTPLGMDAQVDHYNPTFRELVKNWLSENPDPTIHIHAILDSIYELDEPYKTSWILYHNQHANLRWLSKNGNKHAHLM